MTCRMDKGRLKDKVSVMVPMVCRIMNSENSLPWCSHCIVPGPMNMMNVDPVFRLCHTAQATLRK